MFFLRHVFPHFGDFFAAFILELACLCSQCFRGFSLFVGFQHSLAVRDVFYGHAREQKQIYSWKEFIQKEGENVMRKIVAAHKKKTEQLLPHLLEI